MPQDAFTLRYLCEELDGLLKGGKINRIVQPTVDVTVFTVYTKNGVKKLLLDVNPSCPRIGIVDREPPTDLAASNFLMLLKKHLLSATVVGVSLVGFDRIVRVDLMPSAEFFDSPQKTLYVELMGRYSNVILTEKGKVMGGNRGVNFLDNNVRPLIAGLPYKFPPVGDKKQPWDENLKNYFDGKDKITAKNLAAAVQGLAPSTALEIVNGFAAAEQGETVAQKNADEKYTAKSIGERFFCYLNDYIYQTEKHPCVVSENGKVKDVCVYPYGTISGERKFYDCLYQAEDVYFSEKSSERKFKALKDRLNAVTNAGLKKSKKRLSAVLARVKDSENAEENRIKGELLLANIYKLKGGESTIALENYYDGSEIEITLDPRLTPALNAENYYKKYNKQKRAAEMLVPQKQAAQEEIDYLESVETEIALAETETDLKAIEDELTVSGFIKEIRSQKGKKPERVCRPREYDAFGFTVKAGRNNAENDRLTFSSKPEDIWLHAKDYHSSHVVVETGGKKISEKALIAAAEICAYYSKGREGGKTEIVYCERKFVKKPKKAKLGFCTYTDFKSITVKPDSHTELLKP